MAKENLNTNEKYLSKEQLETLIRHIRMSMDPFLREIDRVFPNDETTSIICEHLSLYQFLKECMITTKELRELKENIIKKEELENDRRKGEAILNEKKMKHIMDDLKWRITMIEEEQGKPKK